LSRSITAKISSPVAVRPNGVISDSPMFAADVTLA